MHANRTDANQAQVVKIFRKHGLKVQALNREKNGIPDLLVSTSRGYTFLVEVKDGPKAALTEFQETWWADWVFDPPFVVRDDAQAVALADFAKVCGSTGEMRYRLDMAGFKSVIQ